MTEPTGRQADSLVDELDLRPQRGLNYRLWFYPFVVAFAAMVVLSRQGGQHWGQVPQWAMLLAYMSLACTFWPWPTAWVIMYAATPLGWGLDPWLVATVATVGTCVANLHDYYLVTFIYRYRPVRRLRRTRLYERAARWFERAPFITLAAAGFLPIPIDVVRLLAISQGYSRWKFAAASAVGRWPRYALLAVFARQFNLGWQWILAILGVTVVLGLWRGVPSLVRGLAGLGRKEQTT